MEFSQAFFLAIFFVSFSAASLAQTQAVGQLSPNNGNNKEVSVYQPANGSPKAMDIRDKLVQLASQNPLYEVADRNINIADYQIRLAKAGWLTAFSAQGNLNEYSISPPKTGGTTPIYFPRYNFGLLIPFDIFTRNTNNVRIAKENYMIAMAQKNDKFRQLKVDVLTRYEDYLLAKQKLEYQNQISQDQFTLYKTAEKDYSDGIIKAEDFNKSYKLWVEEQSKKLEMQRNLNVAKLMLEQLIGVPLEDVMNQLK